MADHNTKEGKFRRRSGGAVIGAVTASFFLPPLIATGSPILWGIGGVFLGFTLLGLYNLAVLPTGVVDPKITNIIWPCGIIALCLLVLAFVSSCINSYRIGDRCKSIQSVMLTGREMPGEAVKPDKAHDVFAALGCRAHFEPFSS